jgi:hypothetical protein
MITENRLFGAMKSYLDDIYNDLDCVITPNSVVWYKGGNKIAGLYREYPNRLKLSPTEFNMFRHTFNLPWLKDEDNIPLLELILPYLKFNGGSPAVPILQDLEMIDDITEIGLPSNW